MRSARVLRTSELVPRIYGTAQYARPDVGRRQDPRHFKDLGGRLRMKIHIDLSRVQILSRARYQTGCDDSGGNRRILSVRSVNTALWSTPGKFSEGNGACGHLHYHLLLGTTNQPIDQR